MTTSRRTSVKLLVLVVALTVSWVPAFAQGNGAAGTAIEGVWAMSITLRDCATTAPLGPPFRSLVTFHAGGTVSEFAGTTQFAPGQRSPGYGLWSQVSGATFSMRTVAMILFDTPPAPPAPGFQAGWQLIASTLTLATPDRLDVSATVEFFDINRQLYRSACPTGTGERFR